MNALEVFFKCTTEMETKVFTLSHLKNTEIVNIQLPVV